MIALLLWAALLLPAAPPPITLAVSPRVGIGPLAVRARARCDGRRPGERVFEIVVLEGDLVVRRSELDVDAQLAARPDARLHHAAAWTLPAGEYIVAACFQPGSRCSAPIAVSAQ